MCVVQLFCGVFVCGCLRVQLCYATVLHGRVDVVLSGSLDVQSVRVVSVAIVVRVPPVGARDPAVEHGCLGVPTGVWCCSDLPVHTHSILARSFRWH